jgi:hypothetical protein
MGDHLHNQAAGLPRRALERFAILAVTDRVIIAATPCTD